MIALAPQHPARLAVGAARIAAARATQASHAAICGDVVAYTINTRDLTAEIATDARYLLERMATATSDGVLTAAEVAELRALAAEIEAEATTGRILSHSAA